MKPILEIFGVIAVMIIIIFAAYFMTKYVAVKANGTSGKARYFKMIDRFTLSKDKMFVLIGVEKSVYFIGVTNQGMTLIDQKELSDLPAENEQSRKSNKFMNFLSVMNNAGRTPNRKTNGDGGNFSDFIQQAQHKDDEHDN